jgi:UbiD family decarboxylase
LKAHQTLRDFIRVLEDEGELLSVQEPFDPKYEISMVLSELGKRKAPAILLKRPKVSASPS